MILDLVEFTLKNYREKVNWSVYQNDEMLGKGMAAKDDVFHILKTNEYRVWTEEELQARAEERAAKRKARKKKLIEEKKKSIQVILNKKEKKDEDRKNKVE